MATNIITAYSTERPNEVEFDEFRVYVHSDIREATKEEKIAKGFNANDTIYAFTVNEYDKDEYLLNISRNSNTLVSAVFSSDKIFLSVLDVISQGKLISFVAPCNSTDATGLFINGIEYDIVDMMGDSILETNIWLQGTMVSVLLDTNTHKAYMQNLQSVPCDVLLANDPYIDEDGTIITNIKPLDYRKRIIKLSNFDHTRFNTNPRKFNRYCDFTNFSWDCALCFTEECMVDIYGHIGLVFVIPLDTCPELTLEYVVNNYKNLFALRSIEDETVYSYPEEFEVEETEGETEEGDLVKYLVGSFTIRHSLQVQKVNVGVANFMTINFANVIDDEWYAGNIQFLLNYSSRVRLKIY